MTATLKQRFEEGLARNREIAYELNTFIADNPELSGEEYEASKKYVEICSEQGMDVEENFCQLPTAFRANVYRSANPKAKMAILAEYDALPHLGHGCGHSASGSLSLLTSLSFLHMNEELNVDIDLIGTPDEELHGLKVEMADQGVFKEYDFAMMVHLNANESVPSVEFLALSAYRVKFYGKPAHAAASPWDGVNALDAAQLTFDAIDKLRQQVHPDTRMSYVLDQGGVATNIIPEYTEIQLELRHSSRDYLNTVREKALNCVKGAAIATGADYEVESIGYDYSDMVNNESGVDVIRSVMHELDIPYVEGSSPGSSDIGNVSYECPAFHPMLATSDYYFTLHSQDMVDVVKGDGVKEIIDRGARLIGYTMLHLIENPEVMQQVKDDFNKTMVEK